jgi:hypothetical protein
MDRTDGCRPRRRGRAPVAGPALEAVRPDLERIEALERRAGDLVAALRAALPPAQFAAVWALRDAEEALGILGRDLGERALVEALARALPAHAAAIRAAASRLLAGEAGAAD